MNNQHLIQLLIIVALTGLSGLGWLVRRLQEQAALRRAEQERERRRLESLRTGRPVEEDAPRALPQAAARRQLEELAQRRAAQLQELRRLQQARQRAGAGLSLPVRTPGTSSRQRPMQGGRVSIPGTTGPTVPGTRPARRMQGPIAPPVTRRQAPPARTSPEQSEYNRRRAKQDADKAQQIKQSVRAQRAEESLKAQSRGPLIARPQAPGAEAQRGHAKPGPEAPQRPESPRRVATVLHGMSRDDWRRAFLCQEVFGAPLSIRQTSGDR